MTNHYFYYNDYRDILRDILEKRIAANPRYSLRAFARDLKILPSKLSEVLSAKHGLTRSDVKPLTKALKLDSHEADHFSDLVALSLCREARERKSIELRLAKRRETLSIKMLDLDCFAMIADWYHGAIFEYIRLKEQNHQPESIAKRLGITKIEADEALHRLERLGLIRKEGNRYEPSEKNVFTESAVPSLMIRRFHRQILEKGYQSIDAKSMELRDIFSTIFSIRRSQFPRLKARLRELQIELHQHDTELKKDPDELMCFSYQCFSLLGE